MITVIEPLSAFATNVGKYCANEEDQSTSV